MQNDPVDSKPTADTLASQYGTSPATVKRYGVTLTRPARDEQKRQRDERIIELHEQGWTQRAIAEAVGLAHNTIGDFLRGRESQSDLSDQPTSPDTTAMERALEEEHKAADKPLRRCWRVLRRRRKRSSWRR